MRKANLKSVEKEVRKLLEKKNLDWLLDDVDLHRVKKGDEEGEYIRKSNGDHIVYLNKNNEWDEAVFTLAHELCHKLYINYLTSDLKKKISRKYKTEIKKRSVPSSDKQIINLIKNHKIMDDDFADNIEKNNDNYIFDLKNGERITAKGRDGLLEVFHSTADNKYTNKKWFPTLYSTTNIAEWFSEVFAAWITGNISKPAASFIRKLVDQVKKPEIKTVGSLSAPNLVQVDAYFVCMQNNKVLLLHNSDLSFRPGNASLPKTTINTQFVNSKSIHLEALKDELIEVLVENCTYTEYYIVLGPINSNLGYVYIYYLNTVPRIKNWQFSNVMLADLQQAIIDYPDLQKILLPVSNLMLGS